MLRALVWRTRESHWSFAAAEELSMLVWGVWEDLTGDCGGEFPPSPIQSEGPTGDRIDLMDCEAVRERFPRLVELGGRSGVQT